MKTSPADRIVQVWRRDAVGAAMPVLALVAAGIAVAGDPGPIWAGCLLILPVAGFTWWAWSAATDTWQLAVLTVAVVVPVLVAKSSAALDGSLFLVCLLAVAVAGWNRPSWAVGCLLAVAAAVPIAVNLVRPQDVSVGLWTLGILFPAVVSGLFHRQEDLSAQLSTAREQLAQQAIADERRRVARDVHDIVAHGLAGVLMQVSSARHVLGRDPAAADQALDAAESAGRRTLEEIRRAIVVLREPDQRPDSPGDLATGLPSVTAMAALVEQARGHGQDVRYRLTGDPESVDGVVGLTLYRVVQESLANSTRHAPGAPVTILVDLGPPVSRLLVHTHRPSGPAVRADPAGHNGVLNGVRNGGLGGGFGLIGMRERVAGIGGSLHVGPSCEGWTVDCSVPTRRLV